MGAWVPGTVNDGGAVLPMGGNWKEDPNPHKELEGLSNGGRGGSVVCEEGDIALGRGVVDKEEGV